MGRCSCVNARLHTAFRKAQIARISFFDIDIMNRIYRLVWNKKRNMLIAVSEAATSRGKDAGGETTADGAPKRQSKATRMRFRAASGIIGKTGLLGAAVLTVLPLVAHAQSSLIISNGTTTTLLDSDSSNSAAASQMVVNDGTLDIASTNNGSSILSISGSGSVLLGAQTLTVTNGNANDTFAGTINGSGGFAITHGTQTLGGNNEYVGMTAIGAGSTLGLSGSGSIANSFIISNDGTFDISAASNGASIQRLSGSGGVALGTQTLTLTNANDIFAGAIDGSGNVTINGGTQTLTGVNTHTGATLINANATLALSGSGAIANSSVVATDGTLNISETSNGASVQSLSGSGSVVLGGQTLTLTSASHTFAGVISGSGGVTVAGGTQTLSTNNIYTGVTSIADGATLGLSGSGGIMNSQAVVNNGVIDISAASNGASIQTLSGSGGVILGGQTLTLMNSNDIFTGVISGSGGVTLTSGAETLNGNNTYSGATSIANGATLALSGSGSIANSHIIDNGTFDISATNAGASVQGLSGSGGVVLGGQTLTITNANAVFSGTLSGSGALAITGGIQALNGTNSYTGRTAISNSGTVRIESDSNLGDTSVGAGVDLDNGTLEVVGNVSTSRAITLSNTGSIKVDSGYSATSTGTISGTGTLVKNGAGSLTLDGIVSNSGGVQATQGLLALTGTNTYTGGTTAMNGAIVSITSDSNLGSASSDITLNDGTLKVTGTISTARNVTVSGTGTLSIDANQQLTSTGSVSGNGTLAKNGTGTLALESIVSNSGGIQVNQGALTLSGINTYVGATTVSNGASLNLTGSGALANSSIVTTNGMFDISATSDGAGIRSLSGSGGVVLGGQTLTLTNAGDSFAGAISGSGGVALTGGTQVFSGNNTYSGTTVIGAGTTLMLTNNGTIANSAVVNGNGITDSTLNIANANGGASIKSLSGSGGVILGAQTLTLTNANDIFSGTLSGTGGLTIAGGSETLTKVHGYTGATNIGTNATLSLSGSGGIANSLVVNTNGMLNIASTTTGASFNSLAGSGGVALGGKTLTLTNANDIFNGALSGSGNVTINGGTQTFGGVNSYTGITTIGAGSTLALSGNGSIDASQKIAGGGNVDISMTNAGASIKSLSGSGGMLLGGKLLTLTNADDIFSGTLSGSGGLMISGGTQTITGINTHTGTTTIGGGAILGLSGNGSISESLTLINNGTFNIGATNAGISVKSLSGSGGILLGTKTLTLTNANDIFSGTISGLGSIEIKGGTQTLTGTNPYDGNTIISTNATLKIASDLNIGSSNSSLNFNAGTLQLLNSLSIARNINLTNTGKIKVDAGYTGTHTGTFSGTGTLVKEGSGTLVLDGTVSNSGGVHSNLGTLTLNGINTYSGGTSINGGTLKISTDINLGDITSNLILNGGTLQTTASVTSNRDITITSLNGTIETTGSNNILTLNGKLTGSGSLQKNGTGMLVLAGDNAGGQGTLNTQGSGWTGGLTINGGSVEVTNPYGLGWGTVSLNGGTIRSTVDLRTGQNLNLTNNGTINVDGGSTVNVGTGPGSNGGSNTGGTGGTNTGNGGGGGTPPENTGGGVSGSGTLVKDGDGTLVVNEPMTNSGGIQVNKGTLTLTGNNSYTGGTNINGGKLQVVSDNNLGAVASGVTFNGGTLQTTSSISTTRNIVITTQNGVVETTGANNVLTLNGNVSGNGLLQKTGDGTLVLGGNNTGGTAGQGSPASAWTGGISINGGQVDVISPGALGLGNVALNAGILHTKVDIVAPQNIQVGAGTIINTDANSTMTVTGTMSTSSNTGTGGNIGGGAGSGSSCFNKTGLGTLNIAGAAQFDTTCVIAGKLLANGNLTSNVAVEQGATLGGSGAINGAVLVRGTMSPGNSPGMLTSNATITMASGSTYKEDIGGPQQASASTPIGVPGYYSYLHVTGNNQFVIQPGVTLAPALKDIYSPTEAGYGSAPFVPSVGQTFRIVTADGGVAGRFTTLAQADGMAPNTRLVAFYNVDGSNSIDLKVLPQSYGAWMANANGNSRAVGTAIDRIVDANQAGTSTMAQDQLLSLASSHSAETLGGFTRSLSGEVHAALTAAAPQAGWSLQNMVDKQLAVSRNIAAESRSASQALWIDLAGNRGNWRGDGAASGFDADRTQITLGADVLDTPEARLGLGISHAKIDVSANAGSGAIKQNSGFVYGQVHWKGVVVDGLASYGSDKLDSSRANPVSPVPSVLSARAEGNTGMLGIGLRIPSKVEGASYEPFTRLTFQNVKRDAYSEEPLSTAALRVGSFSATGTRLVTGLSGASIKRDPFAAPATWKFSVGLGIDGGSLVRVAQSATLAGMATTIGSPRVGRVFLQGGINGTMQLNRQSYVYFGLTGEARSGYSELGGNVGVRIAF